MSRTHHITWSRYGCVQLFFGGLRRMGMVLAILLAALLTALPAPAHAQQESGNPAAVSIAPTSGPVGAHITVNGVRFKSGTPVEAGYATSDCTSGLAIFSGVSGTVANDGTVTLGAVWPQTKMGTYLVCLRDKNTLKTYPSDSPYQVLSALVPSLTVSPSPAVSQGQVTVTGSNFLPSGGSVEVLWGPAGGGGAARGDVCANRVDVKITDATGKFTVKFTAPFTSADMPITVIAVSPQGSCGGTPVLSAQKPLTIEGAASATATAVATSTERTANNVGPPGWPPTGIWSVVYCLIGLLLFLLLLLALLIASRNNDKNQPAVVNQQSGQGTQAGGRLMGATRVSVGPDGRPTASEQFYAQGRRGGSTHIATVDDTAQEMPQLQGPGGAGGYPSTPRYGPTSQP
jgi:hypothetical protein